MGTLEGILLRIVGVVIFSQVIVTTTVAEVLAVLPVAAVVLYSGTGTTGYSSSVW